MGWQDIRSQARDVVHATFCVPATYFPPGSDEGVTVTVRRHTVTAVGGDLDREGYAEQIEDVNRIVLDTEQVTPEYKGKVVLSSGEVLYLEVLERQDDSRYQVWNVLRQRYIPPPPAPVSP